MHILFVAEYYFANPDFVRLSLELTRRKHQVSVVTSFRPHDGYTKEKGINIFEATPFLTIHSVPHSLSFAASKIYKVVQEGGGEVIHSLMDYSTNTASAALVSKLTDVPFVYTVQGMGTRTGQWLVDALAECYDWTIERWISKTARKVILLSKSLVARAKKVGVENNKIVVIPSGIDHKHFNPHKSELRNEAILLRNKFEIENDDVVIGFVGRLVPAKGLSYLLLSMRQIVHEHPNIVLLIVGDGPERGNLERVAKNLGMRTIFAGWQADTAPYYAVMDVFVLPSLSEGLPCVMLEAMAMGKPVVATNVGGNADIVGNEENGFLVPARDPERLAFALKRLIENPNMRLGMGFANRRLVKKFFSWDVIVPKIEEVYNSIMNCALNEVSNN